VTWPTTLTEMDKADVTYWVEVEMRRYNGLLKMRIGWLWLCDDVARLHVEIDNFFLTINTTYIYSNK
jgi:hypothetical protein